MPISVPSTDDLSAVQKTADTAQAAASGAQADVDALAIRVKSLEDAVAKLTAPVVTPPADTTAPTVVASLSSDRKLSITAIDNVSVSKIEYQLPGAQFVTYTAPVSLSNDKQTVQVRATDTSGNIGTSSIDVGAVVVTPPSGNPLASLPTKPWYGGPAYWAKFSKAKAAGWSDPSFFPISVFLGKPSHAAALKAAGVNTYMGAEHDGSAMSTMTSQGMFVLPQITEWKDSEIPASDNRVVGYTLADELEMDSSYADDAARLAEMKKRAAAARAKNDGRFLQANFGNGVLETYWAPGTMPQYVAQLDVSSADKYAYTSPAVDNEFARSQAWLSNRKNAPSNGNAAYAYGWQADQMDKFAISAKPSWVFVETARPYLTEAGARTIKPVQIEGAVWSAIIHGAAGISYFQHNNDPTIANYSIVDGPAAIKNMTKQIADQIGRLAPVINTQSYVWNFGSGLATALKYANNAVYIFAMTDGGTGSRTFTLPAGVAGTVTVVDENRTLLISGGKFTDTFTAEYTHHIYKIS